MPAKVIDFIPTRDSVQHLDTKQLLSLAASNQDTDAEMLAILATSEFAEVRALVAQNDKTPADVLDTLLHDTDSVRISLARNSQAFERVWSLAVDPNSAVRLALAENCNLPEHVYQVLAHDRDERVAIGARRTLDKLRSEDNLVSVLFKLLAKAS